MGGSAVEPAQNAPPVDEKLSSKGDMTPGEEYRLVRGYETSFSLSASAVLDVKGGVPPGMQCLLAFFSTVGR